MSHNLSDTVLVTKPAAIRAAEESIAYFKAPALPKLKPAAVLTPLEVMYAYYDAA
jgi:hypothetical protein